MTNDANGVPRSEYADELERQVHSLEAEDEIPVVLRQAAAEELRERVISGRLWGGR